MKIKFRKYDQNGSSTAELLIILLIFVLLTGLIILNIEYKENQKNTQKVENNKQSIVIKNDKQ
jgi:hypothetical protein